MKTCKKRLLILTEPDSARNWRRNFHVVSQYSGLRVFVATNHTRGHDLLQRYADRLDAVIIDFQYPGGFENPATFIRGLRELYSRIPVVGVSNLPERSDYLMESGCSQVFGFDQSFGKVCELIGVPAPSK